MASGPPFLLRIIPKNLLSWCVGHLVRLPLPRPLARLVVGTFRKVYKISLDDCVEPAPGFASIGDLFVRELKPWARPVDKAARTVLVSPVDGRLRSITSISGPDTQLAQVKEITYSLRELLNNDILGQRLQSGLACNMYLSPPDYHHVHSPVTGKIVASHHVPGTLWPVNEWALHHIPRLFAINERLITFIETARGLVAVVMVGATNVGYISVEYDDWRTNRTPWRRPKPSRRVYQPAISIEAGSKLGTFHMGSAVVILAECKEPLECVLAPGERCTVGKALVRRL